MNDLLATSHASVDDGVVYDAVHGSIDLRDVSDCDTRGVIAGLLRSPILDRLRRIEQLGFASQQFIAADHSRYAHSLGTMQMMRLIVERLMELHAQPFDDLSIIPEYFPEEFTSLTDSRLAARVAQHLLVAALVQDLGELPYNMASIHVFTPSDELRNDVAAFGGIESTSGWTGKELFGVACLRELWMSSPLPAINKKFLVFLIGAKPKRELPRAFQAFRQMLNGVVDADRLDYVFRDGHHTVGKLRGPDAVIESLIGFDDTGPIFMDPGPVSQFLAARAHLYSAVYLSPANRFRIVVLTDLLKGVFRDEVCSKRLMPPSGNPKLSVSDFIELDDVTLSARIRDLRREETKDLPSHVKIALSVFLNGKPRYRPIWLPPPTVLPNQEAFAKAPEELFWDTFSDVGGEMYASGSVRVRNAQFEYYDRIRGLDETKAIPLEYCGGPFSLIARKKVEMLPDTPHPELPPKKERRDEENEPGLRFMPHCILLFEPESKTDKRSEYWAKFDAGLASGRTWVSLMARDPLTPHEVEPNTWNKAGAAPQKIFISYAREDRTIVYKMIGSLNKQNRQYFALIDRFQELGRTPAETIQKYIEAADAVILLISRDYCDKYQIASSEIRREVDLLITLRDRLILIPVAADPFPTLGNAPFLTKLRTTEDVQWMGEDGLRELSTPDVDRAMEKVVTYIDSEARRKRVE